MSTLQQNPPFLIEEIKNWSPDVDFIYDRMIELKKNNKLIEQCVTQFVSGLASQSTRQITVLCVPKALGQLLKTEVDYNVIIHIGEEPNFKEFRAHSNILRCRSKYFNKILSSENIERKDGKYIIKKPNISPQAFEIILK
ncbi:hypothetical protein C1646_759489 [Rhizophagus diaphanus]|nr:hypothetical protein C1646_759489 [Rhizophagus diaphanus] [Rhizophagus sp. MUCL 43196]